MSRVTVVCVYRTGGVFDAGWVFALRRQLHNHFPDCDFLCLTDDRSIPYHWAIPLAYNWPGWWSKLEIFRPGLFKGPILYLDLDTLIIANPFRVASYRGPLAVIQDVGQIRRGKSEKHPQTGAMAFVPGTMSKRVWDLWIENPDRHMRHARGDGEWISKQWATGDIEVDFLQDLYPGEIVSFKYTCMQARPEGPSLVLGHGLPRFSEQRAGWAYHHWRAGAR